MNDQQVDKRNYDVASISRSGRAKRANYIQSALDYDRSKVPTTRKFVEVFSNMFRTKEVNRKAFV